MLTVILCLTTLIFPGAAIVLLLPKHILNVAQKWSLSFGFGSAVVTLELFLYFVIFRLAFSQVLVYFLIIQALVSLGLVIFKIPWQRQFIFKVKKVNVIAWLFGALIVLLLFFSLVQALGKPPVAFDNIAFWGMRAKILLTDHKINFDPHAANYLATFSHSNYPWHLSFLEYWWQVLGASGGELNLISWLYFVSLLIIVGDFVIRRLGTAKGLLLTLVLASQPLLFYHASNNYADLIIGFYAAAAFIFLFQWLEKGRHSDLLLAAVLVSWTICVKNYGIFYILSFLFVLALSYFSKLHKQNIKQWFFTGLALFLPLLPLALFKIIFHLDLHNTQASYGWHPEVFYPFFQVLFISNDWNIWFCAFCVMMVVLVPRIRRDKKLIIAWLGFLSVIAIIVVIFLVTENYQWALDHTALSRAFIPVVPISIALIAFTLKDKNYGTLLS